MDQDIKPLGFFSNTAAELSGGKAGQVTSSTSVHQLSHLRNGYEDTHLICKAHKCYIDEKALLLPSKSKIPDVRRDIT